MGRTLHQFRPGQLAGAACTVFLSMSLSFSADPPFYLKKGSWYETMWASRSRIKELAQAERRARGLPDIGRSDFTLMAWIKTKHAGGTIIAKAPEKGKWLPQGKVFFLRGGALTVDVGWEGAIRSNASVTDGAWHHVALSGRSPLRFYVDGKKIHEGRLDLGPDPEGTAFKIGFCTPDFPSSSGFRGLIDEVRIYGRRLSDREIAQAAQGRPPTSGLSGYWPFEQGARDASGYNAHGTITGARQAEGKQGRALSFNGRAMVVLPGSYLEAALAQLWPLLERDFGTAEARKEIEQERKDGIWKLTWRREGVREIALRYAEKVKDELLREKALRKARGAKTLSDLWAVRTIYHTPPPIRFPETIPLDRDPKLAGWWQFDQEKGTGVRDSSPHRRHGKLSEGFSFDNNREPGRFGWALRFTGRTSVTIPGYKGICGTQPRTVCAWIKTTSRRGEIVAWGKEEGGQYFAFTHIRGRVGITPQGGYYYMRDYVNDGKWHHVAVVVAEADLPNLHDHVTLYLDGEVAVVDDIGLLDLWPVDTAPGKDLEMGRGFSGLIDEVRLYERPLSAEEIEAIYKVKPRSE